MTSWGPGTTTIEYLLGRRMLERLGSEGATESSTGLIRRAELRLLTAAAGLEAGDPGGAFVAAYDAYRMGADALLVRQELRATGGAGSHAVVEDAISAQFGAEIPQYAKPTFERFRRARNAAQYFDPDAPELTESDARWAIEAAQSTVAAVGMLLDSGQVSRFSAD